jgi:hypothetical protein
MRSPLQVLVENKKLIMLTFEIFWIVVFLMEAASEGPAAQVAQFVYVNF